jgi:NADH-quinone oxidoreductase subunit M
MVLLVYLDIPRSIKNVTLDQILFMLLALIYLYMHTPVSGGFHSADVMDLYQAGRNLDATTQGFIFWGLFIAFAIKMPIFPFHTWQPDTYTESPAAATMLLSGIMLKMGIYGVIRWLLPVVPTALVQWGPLAITLSVIGIIYGSIIAIRQRDTKRLVAYSSFAHVGLMSAAVFSLSPSGLSGAVIQMLAHGINVVGLFIVIEIIQQRTGSRDIESLSGISQKNIALTVFFGILMLGSVALPLTNGFPGEFLMLKGVFEYNTYLGAAAGITIILGAVYMLRFFQSIMFGPKGSYTDQITALSFGEGASLFILCCLVFWMGFYPNSFFHLIEPSVNSLLHDVHVQTGLAAPEVSIIK